MDSPLMRARRRSTALAALAMFASAANAASIPGLYNTGVLDDLMLAAAGTADLHYLLVVSPDVNFPGPNAIVASPIAAGYWQPNNSTSQWIGPALNQGYPSGAATHAAGAYTYRLTFDLTGLDPLTASISGKWQADNSGTAIRLNGVSTGNTAGSYTPLFSFAISSGFVSGLNTLDFVVNNLSAGGANPTGLRVDSLVGTAAAVPAPAAGWLLGTGLLGVLGWRKHRR